jgi:iron complex outermembrane receptor protein
VITVTAEKKKEPLQDVGVTLSVLSAAEIRERRIQTLNDVAPTTPNVVIENTIGGQNPVVTIRGVGLNAFDPANNPAVGVYVDEIFMSSLAQLSFDIFDVERVELLKGPQGTLYGRNATGGAINFLSRRPERQADGYLTLGAGDFDVLELEGAYGGPISPHWSGRLSARVHEQGTSFDRNRLTGDDFGHSSEWGARGQLRFENDRWDLNLSLNAARHDGAPHPSKHFGIFDPDFVNEALDAGVLPVELGLGFLSGSIPAEDILCQSARSGKVNRAGCADVFGFQDADVDNRSHRQTPTDGRIERETAGLSVNFTVDIGGMTLTSITGYQQLDREFTELNDANPFEMLHFQHDNQVEQFSQELRLAGSNGKADWIAGIFASSDEVSVRTPVFSDDFLFTRLLIEADQETASLAGFGQATFSLSDRLSLVAGLRYTREEIDYVGGTTDTNPFGTSRLLFDTVNRGDFFTEPLRLSFADDSISEDDLSGKLGLELRANDDWLLFASASKGLKSGGFYADVAFSPEELLPYEPETLWAYELGWKGDLGAGTLFNGALFYYDYRDVQTFVQSELAFKLDNIPEAEVLGADLELIWAAVRGLDVRAGLGLLDSELGAFVAENGPVPAGNRLANAPEVSFNSAVGYQFAVADNQLVSLLLDASYRDEMFRDAENTELAKADDYWLVNARVAWQRTNGLELALWGQNLTDQDIVGRSEVVPLLGSGFESYNPPRRWGISLTLGVPR